MTPVLLPAEWAHEHESSILTLDNLRVFLLIVMSGFLDEMDPDNTTKAEAKSCFEQSRAKRKKVDHSWFFEGNYGFKLLVDVFKTVRFKGKGSEFADLELMLKHYQKYAQDLHPEGRNLEDFAHKAPGVLCEKERDAQGCISDPKRMLHMFRHQYKDGPAQWSGTCADLRLPPALEKKRECESAMSSKGEDVDMAHEAFDLAFTGFSDFDEDDPFGHGAGLGPVDGSAC